MKERGSWIDVQGEYNHISIFIPLFLLFINWETGLSCHAMCRIFCWLSSCFIWHCRRNKYFFTNSSACHFVITIILTWVEHRMRRIWTLGKRQKAIKHPEKYYFHVKFGHNVKVSNFPPLGRTDTLVNHDVLYGLTWLWFLFLLWCCKIRIRLTSDQTWRQLVTKAQFYCPDRYTEINTEYCSTEMCYNRHANSPFS